MIRECGHNRRRKAGPPARKQMSMYGSRFRLWFIFAAWLVVAVFCGFLDNTRKSTLYLPVFLVSSVVMVIAATRKHRPRDYKFELVRAGVVRSPFGFEVRTSPSLLEYVEGDNIISWQISRVSQIGGEFDLSENGIGGWENSSSAKEPIDTDKKREISNAVTSALLYLQLVNAGKIRPK